MQPNTEKRWGKKKKLDSIPHIIEAFTGLLKDYTAGDPMKECVLWTNLTCGQVSDLLARQSIIAGIGVVKQLFKKCGYVKRKMFKNRTLKVVKNRNEQFEHISGLKNEFFRENLPSLSIDTKKKEMLGNFYREGRLYTSKPIEVNDHDFNSFSDGLIIPHGIYDLQNNRCYLTIGKSKDTAEFMCDNIEYHWKNSIKMAYPNAKKILILCDGGGSNSCLHYVVKEQFKKLAGRIQVEIVVAHYPAYCSKWNPIEHKDFCHITRSWQGVVFDNYQIVKELAEKTKTKTGLSVVVGFNDKEYVTGKKASIDFLESMPVEFDEKLPKWNYSFKP
ncbi:hypothetical protein MNBD_GAMMA12-1934 [hydrothermal vent metagenome]|uniref:ISAzo13 family transposase n=1 Tax=hydrothermal vent metagenome TaxID=652676 RepID=A0A3B0YYI8_9ZZZZ